MTQREVRLAELKKRIAALDDERTAIAAEIAAAMRNGTIMEIECHG